MTAIFALKADYLTYIAKVADKSQYKLVTENVTVDFCTQNVQNIIFIGQFWKAYPNLHRIAIKLLVYVRGHNCQPAADKLTKLISIEKQVAKYHQSQIQILNHPPEPPNLGI